MSLANIVLEVERLHKENARLREELDYAKRALEWYARGGNNWDRGNLLTEPNIECSLACHSAEVTIASEQERRPHKVMTPEEYAVMPLIGWHEVCRDVDGFGALGVRFLGEVTLTSGFSRP